MNLRDIPLVVRLLYIPELDLNRDGAVSPEEISWGCQLITDEKADCTSECYYYEEKQQILRDLKTQIEQSGPLVYFKGFDLFGSGKPQATKISFADLDENRRKRILARDALGNNDALLSMDEAIPMFLAIPKEDRDALLTSIREGRFAMNVEVAKGGGRYAELSIFNGREHVPVLAMTEDMDLILYYPNVRKNNPGFAFRLEEHGIIEKREDGKAPRFETASGQKVSSFEAFSRIAVTAFIEENFREASPLAKRMIHAILADNGYVPVSSTLYSITVFNPRTGRIKRIELDLEKDPGLRST